MKEFMKYIKYLAKKDVSVIFDGLGLLEIHLNGIIATVGKTATIIEVPTVSNSEDIVTINYYSEELRELMFKNEEEG